MESEQPERAQRSGWAGDERTDTVDLVQRAQSGDRDSFDDLLRRYYPRVLRIVRARLGARLRGNVESTDILQDALTEAVRDFDDFRMRDESSLVHWLAKIVEHKIRAAADYFDAQKRESGRQVSLGALTGSSWQGSKGEPADALHQPIDGMLSAEDFARLEHCMEQLPEESREVIILRYFEGADWKTVAARIGLERPDAARMRCRRAIVELERIWRFA